MLIPLEGKVVIEKIIHYTPFTECTLGERLRACRKHLKLTLKQVSFTSGLSIPYISEIERDISTPSLSVLFRLLEVYEITAEQFFSNYSHKITLDRYN